MNDVVSALPPVESLRGHNQNDHEHTGDQAHVGFQKEGTLAFQNLPTVDQMRVSDGSGVNSRAVETVRIESLVIGEARYAQLRAPVLGEGPQQDNSLEADGTIGFELFRDYLLTLDYPQNELRVSTGELATADGRTILTYVVDSGTPHVWGMSRRLLKFGGGSGDGYAT